jgi:hypothetical protein
LRKRGRYRDGDREKERQIEIERGGWYREKGALREWQTEKE